MYLKSLILLQSSSVVSERFGDELRAWCTDSGISSSSSIATVSSDKLSLRTGSAAAASSRRHAANDDDDYQTVNCQPSLRQRRQSSAAHTDSSVAFEFPPPAGLTIFSTWFHHVVVLLMSLSLKHLFFQYLEPNCGKRKGNSWLCS